MVLKKLLNEGASPDDPAWWVVEEGQSGRTTCREDFIEGDRNGLRQLMPILESHKPIDLVAVMLGTNDLKLRFNATAYDIARGVKNIAVAIGKTDLAPGGRPPRVLVICPPPTVSSSALHHLFGDCVELSGNLPKFYQALALEAGADFLDAGKFIKSSELDGIHLDASEHLKLAEAVAEKIRSMGL